MAASDKKVGEAAGKASQMIDEPLVVQYSKFSDGLKTVFLGVMEMLESVTPRQRKVLLEPIISQEGESNGNETQAPAGTDPTNDAAGITDPGDGLVSDGPVPDETEPDETADSAGRVTDSEEGTVTLLTVDDITKVIVAKLEQKRSNNELIGKLLASYNAERVSELKPSQYEAFLTDISQM